MGKRSFLILYGHGGSGPDHWQSWLFNELTGCGETVYYPDFSDKDQPGKEVWLKELHQVIEGIPEDEEVTVIAHSLACILWFHHSTSKPVRAMKRVILVSPVSPNTEFAPVPSFFPIPANMEEVTKAAEHTLFIHSSTDPFCSAEDAVHYMNLGASCLMLPDMGHINVESGHGPWPLILNLCLQQSALIF